jgi:hypothetical protein
MGLDAKGQEAFVRWPTGLADYNVLTYAATFALECRNSKNMFYSALTGNVTINLDTTVTLEPQSVTKNIERFPGDIIVFVFLASAAARTVTFGTGILGTAIVVADGKNHIITAEYINETLGYCVKSNLLLD